MTLKQLRELMEHRGLEGVQKIEGLGGCAEVARKLNTSVSAGLSGDRSDLEHRSVNPITILVSDSSHVDYNTDP